MSVYEHSCVIARNMLDDIKEVSRLSFLENRKTPSILSSVIYLVINYTKILFYSHVRKKKREQRGVFVYFFFFTRSVKNWLS